MTAVAAHAAFKLGKLPPKHDARTLHLARYLVGPRIQLPPPPDERDWNAKLVAAELGMYANDKYGCCGFAGVAHAQQTWCSNTGVPYTITEQDVLAWYAECTGFDPTNPDTDQGVVLLDALNYFRKKGLIYAFAKLNHHDLHEVNTGVNLFGGAYVGAGLPLTAQVDGPWIGKRGRLAGDDIPNSWGGHCMWSPKYRRPSHRPYVTWGREQAADDQWWLNYVDEAYVILGPAWASENMVAPVGFDLATLRADIAAI